MTVEELKKEWSIFADAWKVYKGLLPPQNTDEYWERVVSETSTFYKKHETELCKQIALAIADELERRSKNESKNAERR